MGATVDVGFNFDHLWYGILQFLCMEIFKIFNETEMDGLDSEFNELHVWWDHTSIHLCFCSSVQFPSYSYKHPIFCCLNYSEDMSEA